MHRTQDRRTGAGAAARTAVLAAAAALASGSGVSAADAGAGEAGTEPPRTRAVDARHAADPGAEPVVSPAHAGEQAVESAERVAPAAERTGGAADSAVRVRRRVRAMGTLLTGTAWAGRRSTAVQGLEAAVRSIDAMEDRLSTWRDDTELAALNAASPGSEVSVGDTLLGLLQEIRRWRRATDGAFDPGVGRLVEAWDLRGEGRVPGRSERRQALDASGLDCWAVDASGGTVRPRCEGAWIDAGAFGKGAALRDARGGLRDAGVEAALLDFGGQFLAVGRPPGATGWRVGVAHPSRRERPVAQLEVADASVATSSASERFVVVDGEERGHVLDPRTGEPVPPWGSVTVVTDDPLAADALSTGLFVLGPERAAEWAAGREEVGVLLLRQQGDGALDAVWNEAMERHLVERPRELDDSGAGPSAAPRRNANP